MTKILLLLVGCLVVACGGQVGGTPTADPVGSDDSAGTAWRELNPEQSAQHLGCVTVWNNWTPPGCFLTTAEDPTWRTCVADPNPIVVIHDPQVKCQLSVSFECSCEGK